MRNEYGSVIFLICQMRNESGSVIFLVCQMKNDAAADDGGDGDAGTTHPSWQVPESNTHRDQISRSGTPHSDI